MARRKAIQETGDDTLTEAENAQLAAEQGDSGMPDALAAPPDFWTRAQQGACMAGYEIDGTHAVIPPTGMVSTVPETKPAEKTSMPSNGGIVPVYANAGRPGTEAPAKVAHAPGAGDPQNGVILPPTKAGQQQAKYISWVDVSKDVAQHYPAVEP